MASTNTNPLADAATAMQFFYCPHCGHVDLYLAEKVALMRQQPNCPVDHYQQKPIEAADTDPEMEEPVETI